MRMKIYHVVLISVVGFLISCVSDSSNKNPIGIIGTYYDSPPSVSAGTLNVSYTCIEENGKYDNFYLISNDTNSLDKINGMRIISGVWTLKNDTLKIENENIGILNDENGVGMDWIEKVSMNPIPTTQTFRINSQEDGFNFYTQFGELVRSSRHSPHELIKSICPN